MKIIVYLTMLSLFVACFSSGSGSSTPATSTTTSLSADQLLEAGAAAMTATGTSLPSAKKKSLSFDPTADCTDDGDPEASTVSDGDWAAAFLFCKLMADGNNPESPKGGIRITQAINCIVERNLGSNLPTTVETASETIDLATDPCTTGLGSGSMPLVIERGPADFSANWDYYVELGPGDRTLYKNSNGIIAVHRVDSSSEWSYVINSNDNTFRFEAWDSGNDRHLRLLVDASVSSTGVLTNPTAASLGYDTNGHTFISADWDGTNEQYDYLNTAYTQVTGYPKCTGGGDCSAMTAIAQNAAFVDWTGSGYIACRADMVADDSILINYTSIDTTAMCEY